MDKPKGHIAARVLWIVVGVLVLGVALAVGLSLTAGRTAYESTSVESAPVAGVDVAGEALAPDVKSEEMNYSGAPVASGEARVSASDEGAADGAGSVEPMVIRTASVDLRVDDTEQALADLRTIARSYDAEVTDLYVYGGAEDPVRPLAEGTDSSVPSPASATATLRVPAADLEALIADVSELGVVVTQTGSASDVTEQYIDLAARMKNLKAEEARLRSFFDRAEKVSELLAVESELARVRGDIEALQAQIDYLERQVAKATLTVSMSESGPIVRPESGDWGFLEAITLGIQAAARVLTTLITGLIAIAPLLLVAGLVVWIVRAVRKRRSKDTPAPEAEIPAQTPTPGDEA